MALQLNDITAVINRATNLVQGNSDACFMVWFETTVVSTAPDYLTAFAQIDAGYTAWNGIFSDASVSDGSMEISADNGGGPSQTPNHILAANTPVNFAYRRFGTTHQFLVNGFIVGTATENMAAVTFVDQVLGFDGFSVIPGVLRFWDWKEWNTSKSVGTVRAEMAVYGSVDSVTGLVAFTPLLSDLLDDSGNGNDWSGAGDFEFVANPSLPTNVSAALATSISTLPHTEVVAETYNMPLWYRRIPAVGETYLGAWGFGGLGTYTPTAFVWTVDGTVEWPNASFQTIGVNVPIQFPVVAASNFFVEFRSDYAGPGGQLDVSFLPQPTTAIPIGNAFLVTDDSEGFGASIISATDGEVFQFRYPNFPASEAGEGLIEGNRRVMIVATSEPTGDELWIYDAAFTLIDTVARGTDTAAAITSNKVDTWYVFYNPPGAVDGYILRYDINGVVNPVQIGTIPDTDTANMRSMAINPDETVLYYQLEGNGLGAIRAWDLVNNVALPDLVASGGAGWFGLGGLLTLPDGSVIGGQDQFLSGAGGFLRSYDSSGAQQWSFDTGTLGIDYHGGKLIYGFDYPDSIWLVVHFSDGHSRFIHLDSATGADLGDGFDVPTFSAGAYDPAESATPEARFGPAPSCFNYMLQEAEPACPGLTGAPRTDGLPYSPYEPGI